MKMVGPSGGAVSSSDGNLAVNIPAGALPADVTITTEPAAAPAAGAVGTVYEIGPTGTQFAMPVTLTLHYDMAALSGATESSLRVATFAGGSWQLLPGAVVDTQAKTVSGVTTHLSPYAIVTEMVGQDLRDGADGVRLPRDRHPDAGGGRRAAGPRRRTPGPARRAAVLRPAIRRRAPARRTSARSTRAPRWTAATTARPATRRPAASRRTRRSVSRSRAPAMPAREGRARTAAGRPVRPLRPATRRRPPWRARAIRARPPELHERRDRIHGRPAASRRRRRSA